MASQSRTLFSVITTKLIEPAGGMTSVTAKALRTCRSPIIQTDILSISQPAKCLLLMLWTAPPPGRVLPLVIAGHRYQTARALECVAEDRFGRYRLGVCVEGCHAQFLQRFAPPPWNKTPSETR